jgi:hypothetical protein
MRKVKFHEFHGRYRAARNKGTAAVLLEFSALGLFYTWRDLTQPFPSERPSIVRVAALHLFENMTKGRKVPLTDVIAAPGR